MRQSNISLLTEVPAVGGGASLPSLALSATEKHQVTHSTPGSQLSKLNALVSWFEFLTSCIRKVGL